MKTTSIFSVTNHDMQITVVPVSEFVYLFPQLDLEWFAHDLQRSLTLKWEIFYLSRVLPRFPKQLEGLIMEYGTAMELQITKFLSTP